MDDGSETIKHCQDGELCRVQWSEIPVASLVSLIKSSRSSVIKPEAGV